MCYGCAYWGWPPTPLTSLLLSLTCMLSRECLASQYWCLALWLTSVLTSGRGGGRREVERVTRDVNQSILHFIYAYPTGFTVNYLCCPTLHMILVQLKFLWYRPQVHTHTQARMHTHSHIQTPPHTHTRGLPRQWWTAYGIECSLIQRFHW